MIPQRPVSLHAIPAFRLSKVFSRARQIAVAPERFAFSQGGGVEVWSEGVGNIAFLSVGVLGDLRSVAEA